MIHDWGTYVPILIFDCTDTQAKSGLKIREAANESLFPEKGRTDIKGCTWRRGTCSCLSWRCYASVARARRIRRTFAEARHTRSHSLAFTPHLPSPPCHSRALPPSFPRRRKSIRHCCSHSLTRIHHLLPLLLPRSPLSLLLSRPFPCRWESHCGRVVVASSDGSPQ